MVVVMAIGLHAADMKNMAIKKAGFIRIIQLDCRVDKTPFLIWVGKQVTQHTEADKIPGTVA